MRLFATGRRMSGSGRTFRLWLLVATALLLLAMPVVAGFVVAANRRAAPDPGETKLVTGGLVNFDYRVENPSLPLDGAGGGLAADGTGIYIVRSQVGVLQRFDIVTRRIAPVRLGLPENNFARLPEKSSFGNDYDKREIRYNDIEFLGAGAERQLVVSYTFYDPEKSCFTSRLAVHALAPGWDAPLDAGMQQARDGWRIVHETRPCLTFKKHRHPFSGQQAGGRMSSDGKGALYVTVGDHEFDGLDGADGGPVYPQLADNDYGKVLRFDTSDWSSSIFTTGHRNPQGIAVDAQGHVWEVEHGPMGGDELNLLRDGGNYGWPVVTLGVAYSDGGNDAKNWPPSPRQGGHDGYVMPAFAWVPSPGLGNIKQLSGLDPRIDGDLLVVGMGAGTLFRLRLDGERIVYAEPTPIGARIRYAEVANGAIYLLLDDGRFATLHPRPTGDAERAQPTSAGPAVVLTRCQECHARPDMPRLTAILGSAVASQAGVHYTAALTAAGGVWSEARLRAFLSDPQGFAPGTAMPQQPLGEAELAAVLDGLKAR